MSRAAKVNLLEIHIVECFCKVRNMSCLFARHGWQNLPSIEHTSLNLTLCPNIPHSLIKTQSAAHVVQTHNLIAGRKQVSPALEPQKSSPSSQNLASLEPCFQDFLEPLEIGMDWKATFWEMKSPSNPMTWAWTWTLISKLQNYTTGPSTSLKASPKAIIGLELQLANRPTSGTCACVLLYFHPNRNFLAELPTRGWMTVTPGQKHFSSTNKPLNKGLAKPRTKKETNHGLPSLMSIHCHLNASRLWQKHGPPWRWTREQCAN